MRNRAETALSFSTAALVASGFLALIAAELYDLSILLLPAILYLLKPLGEWLDGDLGITVRRAYRGFTTTIAVFFTVAWFLWVKTFDLFPTVIWLVIFIIGHKLVHKKTRRDYYQLFLMCFFLLACACATEPGATIGPVLFLFLLSAVVSFVLLEIWSENDQAAQAVPTGVVQIGSPLTWDLLKQPSLLRHGFGLWTLAVFIGCFMVLIGLFMFTPRMEAGFLHREGETPAQTGVSGSVDLDRSGPIFPDTSLIFQARFPEEPDGRYDGPLYWRVITYHSFSGRGWERLPVMSDFMDRAQQPDFYPYADGELSRSRLGRGPLTKQEVFLNEIPVSGLPALSIPQRIRCAIPVTWHTDRDFTVLLLQPRANLSYEAWSEVDEPGPEALRPATMAYSRVMNRQTYRILTRHLLSPEVEDLARRLTADAANPYDKAKAVENWLRSGEFLYTLVIPETHSGNPVDDFILRTRTGHCELFASAMALMLRSLGIPTRVVGGYYGGLWMEGDQAYVVRNDMAHLWVEAYLVDHGWVRFDPSPVTDDTFSLPSWTVKLEYLGLRLQFLWHQHVVRYQGGLSRDTLQRIVAKLGAVIPRVGDSDLRGGPYSIRVLGTWAVLILVPLGAFSGLFFLTRRRRFLRHGRVFQLSEDQKRATRLYHRLKRRLARRGMTCSGKTAEEVLAELRDSPQVHWPCVRTVVEAYNLGRFGGQPLPRARYLALVKSLRTLYTP